MGTSVRVRGTLLVEKLEPGPTICLPLAVVSSPGPSSSWWPTAVALGTPLPGTWCLRWQEWEPFPGGMGSHKAQWPNSPQCRGSVCPGPAGPVTS